MTTTSSSSTTNCHVAARGACFVLVFASNVACYGLLLTTTQSSSSFAGPGDVKKSETPLSAWVWQHAFAAAANVAVLFFVACVVLVETTTTRGLLWWAVTAAPSSSKEIKKQTAASSVGRSIRTRSHVVLATRQKQRDCDAPPDAVVELSMRRLDRTIRLSRRLLAERKYDDLKRSFDAYLEDTDVAIRRRCGDDEARCFPRFIKDATESSSSSRSSAAAPRDDAPALLTKNSGTLMKKNASASRVVVSSGDLHWMLLDDSSVICALTAKKYARHGIELVALSKPSDAFNLVAIVLEAAALHRGKPIVLLMDENVVTLRADTYECVAQTSTRLRAELLAHPRVKRLVDQRALFFVSASASVVDDASVLCHLGKSGGLATDLQIAAVLDAIGTATAD